MGILLNLAFVDQMGSQAQQYFLHHVLSWAMLVQIAATGVALLLAHKATRAIRTWFTRQRAQCEVRQESCDDLRSLITFIKAIGPLLAVVFIEIASDIANHFNWDREGLYTVEVFLMALFLVRFFTDQMKNRFWARILAIVIWFWSSLYIFHVIDPWHNILRHISFDVGKLHITLFIISRAFALLLFLYWLSRNLIIAWRFWLTQESGLTPAIQILLYKLSAILLFSLSGVLVLHYVGLDLTVFALFSGALGLGLGIGLQKVFANLVSGFVILADKSIKPGDVIQLRDKYGWINFLGSRYVSVISRDGTEHLIPNENLITGEVINWSHSNNLVRLKVPAGISYGSDLEKARDLMLESAAVTKRVLKDPRPVCLLSGFGDNAVNLDCGCGLTTLKTA